MIRCQAVPTSDYKPEGTGGRNCMPRQQSREGQAGVGHQCSTCIFSIALDYKVSLSDRECHRILAISLCQWDTATERTQMKAGDLQSGPLAVDMVERSAVLFKAKQDGSRQDTTFCTIMICTHFSRHV